MATLIELRAELIAAEAEERDAKAAHWEAYLRKVQAETRVRVLKARLASGERIAVVEAEEKENGS